MPRLNHDRPGMTYACPACDLGGEIYERAGNGNARDDRPYRCQSCGVSLHYVVERPTKTSGGSRNAEQRTLTSHYGINAHRIKALQPEDVGLSPVGVRGGAD